VNYIAALPIIGFILSAGLGAFTFLSNPRGRANVCFAVGMASVALIEAGNAMVSLSFLKPGLDSAGIRLALAGHAALPAAWLPFSSVFLRSEHAEGRQPGRYLLAIASGASLFFAFLVMTPWLMGHIIATIEDGGVFSSGLVLRLAAPGRYLYVYLVLGLVVNLIQMENTLRSSRGTKRWRIKYVIFGVGSILAYYIYLSSKALLYSSVSAMDIPLTSAVMIISAAVMGVFIVRHKLLDVDIFVSRYVVYNSATVLAVGLYLLATGLAVYGMRYLKVPFGGFLASLIIFASMLALVVILFIERVRRKLQLFINRHFYRHKYEFRDKWMETVERMGSRRGVDEVRSTLADIVSETMCARVFIWVYDPVSKVYLTREDSLPAGLRRIDDAHPILGHIKAHDGPFLVAEMAREGAPAGAADEEIIAATGAAVCAPLRAGTELVGFLLQGPDFSGEPYTRDDFDLLKAVTAQAAMQIHNTRLSRDLMSTREFEAFNRMSAFLMHDLKNLTNSLSLVSQNAQENLDNPEFQKDAIRTVDSTVVRMKRLIERLSKVPKTQEIIKERADINRLVEGALKKAVFTESKDVEITRDFAAVPHVSVDPDAMEMVFLNMLVNAYDAIARKGRIGISTALEGDSVCVAFSDNGSGIPAEFMQKGLFEPFRTTKKNGMGIGLFQCRSIIEAHGGAIEVESEAGKGTVFRLRIPVERGR
jgi:putative PEP-CTERM system histidine kinase